MAAPPRASLPPTAHASPSSTSTPPAAEQTAEDVRQAGGQAIALPGDGSNDTHVHTIVAAAAEALGALDLLVNNAGIAGGARASAEELGLERWDEMLRVNFRGYLLMSRAALA